MGGVFLAPRFSRRLLPRAASIDQTSRVLHPLPPSHPSAPPPPPSSPIPHQIISSPASPADRESAKLRHESAPPAPRSHPSAPPDVMNRPHFPKDQAFSRGNGFLDDGVRGTGEIEEAGAVASVTVEQSPSRSSSPSASSPAAAMSSCGQYMLHRVGKLDTLAGVAIKYGVEVKRREYSGF